MTSITVNGEILILEDNPNIAGLLQVVGLADKRVAVELNREIVPRNRQGETWLKDGDRVEIVQAIGGG